MISSFTSYTVIMEFLCIKRSYATLKIESNRNKDKATNRDLKKDRGHLLEKMDNFFHNRFVFAKIGGLIIDVNK